MGKSLLLGHVHWPSLSKGSRVEQGESARKELPRTLAEGR